MQSIAECTVVMRSLQWHARRCLGPAELRPTTVQLLEDAFFHKKPPPANAERRSSAQLLEPQTSAGAGSNYGGALAGRRCSCAGEQCPCQT